MKMRDLLVAAGAAALSMLLLAGPWSDRLDGLSIDILHWLRATVAPPPPRAEVPLAVIAIDEATYRAQPFRDAPRVMWTREIAQVLNALGASDVAVIGMDMIFPTSVEKYLRGFDRDFLLALRGLARNGRIVLSKVQHSAAPIAPHAGQSYAVGHNRNIRVVNLLEDKDGILRRAPLTFSLTGRNGETRREPAFATEIAGRLSGAKISLSPDGALQLDGKAVPGTGGNALNLNFDTGPGALKVYSFVDIHACAKAGRADFLRRHFAGKAVLIGLAVDVEDRKLTAARLATTNLLRAGAPRCGVAAAPDASGQAAADRDSLPGVFVHAAAIANILRQDGLRLPGRGAQAGLLFALALAAALLAMYCAPLPGGGLLALLIVAWAGAATLAFRGQWGLPLLDGAIAAILSFGLILAYRFAVADREKRFLRRSFAYYLAPVVIDRLVETEEPPVLGGETREVTILFSDIANFTAISESLEPEALVAMLNEYLSAMTDIVERHGGFVDKYIGDAIVAVFGAPLHDAKHASSAIAAALECHHRLLAMQDHFNLPEGRWLSARIGLNSGLALVGNIGSRRRFNYTVIGDAVNLAARLEGANKLYGSSILLSGDTAAAGGIGFRLREVDSVRVVGRQEPVAIFEPLGRADGQDSGPALDLAAFAAALADYRAGRFAAAAENFTALAQAGDEVAGAMAARAAALAADPPTGTWDGVSNLDSK